MKLFQLIVNFDFVYCSNGDNVHAGELSCVGVDFVMVISIDSGVGVVDYFATEIVEMDDETDDQFDYCFDFLLIVMNC